MYFALCSLKHRKYDIDVNFTTHKRDKTFIFFCIKINFITLSEIK